MAKKQPQRPAKEPVKDPSKGQPKHPVKAHEPQPAEAATPVWREERPDLEAADGNADWVPTVIVAGIGASAGGLQALSELLEHLPSDPGLALVVVQHLAPKYPSALSELLSAVTKLPVIEATEGIELVFNQVYVIPPDRQMEIQQGKLHLTPRPTDGRKYLPIDYFFRSLAAQCGDRAIGVVLSGSASDGSEGLREIKAAGGISIAQDPASASYDSMPQAAIATGIVDLVLPPREIAAELVRLARHPYVEPARRAPAQAEISVSDTQLTQIFLALRSTSGIDFSHYKQATIKRRLQRRMALHKVSTADEYLKFLRHNAGEVNLLFQDMLINVTRFFREPDTFTTLRDVVFPKIIQDRQSDQPIRVWVPGCSTGEEPYSLAIALMEFLGDEANGVPIQLFATDVSESAIQAARNGVYSESIAGDVSPGRLLRFFSRIDGNYRISKSVRDLCVFARQDLTRDPPFSKLDLIVCRNVLIYLGQPLQQRLMHVFHYALKPQAYLMLGSAESVGPQAELFKTVDKRNRVYSKKPAVPRVEMDFRVPTGGPALVRPGRKAWPAEMGTNPLMIEASQLLLSKFAPPGVIVDADLQIVQFRGQTGLWLEPAPGDASLNLLKMAREGLHYDLRAALYEAQSSQAAVRKQGLRVKTNEGQRDVDIEVIPLAGDGEIRHYLVLFQEPGVESRLPPAAEDAPDQSSASKPQSDSGREQLRQLQQELAASREYLQSIIQELEAANEELQSANEEILSSNEELQSTNEELDTAKEELQSANEELNTVNEDLQRRNEELGRVNSDLLNLLGNVQIALLIVTRDLRIRRFTPLAQKLLNLIPGDAGRPLGHIRPNIDCPDLEQITMDVIEKVEPIARDVCDSQGHWFSLRVRPYKNMENRIDGAVLVLFDIDVAKRYSAEINDLRLFAEAAIDAVPNPLVVLNGDSRIHLANRAFCAQFDVTQAQLQEKLLTEIGGGRWNQPRVSGLLAQLLSHDEVVDGYAVDLPTPTGSQTVSINGRRIAGEQAGSVRLLLAMDFRGAAG